MHDGVLGMIAHAEAQSHRGRMWVLASAEKPSAYAGAERVSLADTNLSQAVHTRLPLPARSPLLVSALGARVAQCLQHM